MFQIELPAAPGTVNRMADQVRTEAEGLGLAVDFSVRASRGFLIGGLAEQSQAERIARELLAEPIVQVPVVRDPGEDSRLPGFDPPLFAMLRTGVTDPEAESVLRAIRDMGLMASGVRSFRRYDFQGLSPASLRILEQRALVNESIEQVVRGSLAGVPLSAGAASRFSLVHVPLRDADPDQLLRISREGTLSLTLVEMQAIQAWYRELGRDPTDIELETIAQTWSEHCSHKTLAGRVHYRDEHGSRQFSNMLKETIFAATVQIRERLGGSDWCVSVFRDNAGVVRFDDEHNLTFKVETHNRPSAIEPYGGANTGLGGVIRDTLGTGMGARPVCSTDVFCFAPPATEQADLPPGVLHPRRIMRGVVAGVRDYGNRMGIPTVNGAVFFDSRYVGNPMVFCGNVGLIPHRHSFKQPQAGDWIVSVGGRTGRDGIHGATFSSVELNDQSEKVSSGAVQIGNAITEKMVVDVLLQARDRELFHAVTDCGAGGFSSAVGEMAESLGAEVWLEKAPLKYAGLTPVEIWISEAQERMILAVPPGKWDEFDALCRSEDVEATAIGRFNSSGQLVLKYDEVVVGQMDLGFLHGGRPPVVREAVYTPPAQRPVDQAAWTACDPQSLLLEILGHPNVASKHWIIRQYDHEVQGGSVIKPLVGAREDGPSDAAVVRPLLSSNRGLTVSCGLNPLLGDLDPGRMAAASIDEAIRNSVATGADPDRIGILDNFCWGYTDRPETLGTLVRSALACQQTAVAMLTPFISGKDSLNNEFSYQAADGKRQTISIPPTLLISALGQVPDVMQCVTMDWKEPGNLLYLLGSTGDHLGGSHALLVAGQHGCGEVAPHDPVTARSIYSGLHRLMQSGLVRSCHDLSEGGLAVAAAEMALAGGLGGEIDLDRMVIEGPLSVQTRLFAESNSRLLCEVAPADAEAFEAAFQSLPCARIGVVRAEPVLQFKQGEALVFQSPVAELKSAWQKTLDWK